METKEQQVNQEILAKCHQRETVGEIDNDGGSAKTYYAATTAAATAAAAAAAATPTLTTAN